mmetsp:Transcript_64577/g.192368  ORF Transcript_64577/g.192368 Transcript_64577/m.192368 type:complete len:241 (+) Transcript_64577:607-1329(+)
MHSYSLSTCSIVTWQPLLTSPRSCGDRSSAPVWRAAASSCARSLSTTFSGINTRATVDWANGTSSHGRPPTFSGRQLRIRSPKGDSSGGAAVPRDRLPPSFGNPARPRARGSRLATGTCRISPLASLTLKRAFFGSLPMTSAIWPFSFGASDRPAKRTRSPTSRSAAGTGPVSNSFFNSSTSTLTSLAALRALSRRRCACAISARKRSASVIPAIAVRQRTPHPPPSAAGPDGKSSAGLS